MTTANCALPTATREDTLSQRLQVVRAGTYNGRTRQNRSREHRTPITSTRNTVAHTTTATPDTTTNDAGTLVAVTNLSELPVDERVRKRASQIRVLSAQVSDLVHAQSDDLRAVSQRNSRKKAAQRNMAVHLFFKAHGMKIGFAGVVLVALLAGMGLSSLLSVITNPSDSVATERTESVETAKR